MLIGIQVWLASAFQRPTWEGSISGVSFFGGLIM